MMRALSVKQPWANLIADGRKTIEVRTWRTTYRGLVLIVSSQKPKIEPIGSAVAIAEIVDCRPMGIEDEGLACCEMRLGDFAWVLNNVRPIVPIKIKGALGIYRVDIEERHVMFRGEDHEK